MAVARSLHEFDYILKAERDLPPEKQTVFRLKPLGYSQYEQLPPGDEGSAHWEFARKALTWGLVGWRNLHDAEGNPVEFRRSEEGGRVALPDETLSRVLPWVAELAAAVIRGAQVSEEAAKNS